MRVISLISSSLNGQYTSLHSLEQDISSLIEIFKTIEFSVQNSMCEIWFDDQIEANKPLADERTLRELLAKIDRDIRQRWFWHTRNRMSLCSFPWTSANISSSELTDFWEVEVPPEAINANDAWIGFPGIGPFGLSLTIRVPNADSVYIDVKCCCNVSQLNQWWPLFEPNPKHGPVGYYDNRGEWVSPMPLNDEDAQRALDVADVTQNRITSTYNGSTFRYLKTHPNRNIYHGFLDK